MKHLDPTTIRDMFQADLKFRLGSSSYRPSWCYPIKDSFSVYVRLQMQDTTRKEYLLVRGKQLDLVELWKGGLEEKEDLVDDEFRDVDAEIIDIIWNDDSVELLFVVTLEYV